MNKEQIVNEIKGMALKWIRIDRAWSNCYNANQDLLLDDIHNEQVIKKITDTRDMLEKINETLSELETFSEACFWKYFSTIADKDKDILNEIFDINLNLISVEELRKTFFDNYSICDVRIEITNRSDWEGFVYMINIAYKNLISEKFNYDERPFFNDNFAILKILSDSQIKIGDGYYVALSQKDVAVISGFSVNKAQGIMNTLIKLEYLTKADNGKYKITDSGKIVLESLLKVPVAKIIE